MGLIRVHVVPTPDGVTSKIFLNYVCSEKQGKWIVFHFKMPYAFSLKRGVLKIYLCVFDKKKCCFEFHHVSAFRCTQSKNSPCLRVPKTTLAIIRLADFI